MDKNLYSNYTSTSMLRGIGIDENRMTELCVEWFNQCIISLLPSDKSSKILDIGCGYGRYLLALNNAGYINSEGIDISTEQISYAKNKLKLSNVFEADVMQYLEDKKNSYDCIIAFDVLEHFDTNNLMKLVGYIYNSLKPQGCLIIQVPNALAPLSPFAFGDITHKQYFTVHSIEQLLSNYSFSEVKHYEALPHIHGLFSLTRRVLWRFMIKPMLSAFILTLYGNRFDNIYTANLITTAIK